VCLLNYYHSKIMSCMSDFDDYPFPLLQNCGKCMGFLKFFFTSEEKIFETALFVKFLWQFYDCSYYDLVLKLVDGFLASCYASLTTKSWHFVWSITSQNLNQFKKNLVFWNQHESFVCILNLRRNWDGGLTGWDSWHRMTLIYIGLCCSVEISWSSFICYFWY